MSVMDDKFTLQQHLTENEDQITSKKFTREQKVVLVALFLGDFTCHCANSVLAPFFPAEASRKGMSSTVSGLVFAVYALIMFICSPIIGIFMSRLGVKFVMCSGIILAGACNTLFGLSDKLESTLVFTIYCFTLRIVEGFGAAAYSTAGYIFIAKVFPNDMGFVLGVAGVAISIGLSIGPAIGGILFDWGGYGLPFYTLGILFLLMGPLNMVLLPTINIDEINSKNSIKSLWILFILTPVFLMSIVVVVLSVIWSFLGPTLEIHFRGFDLTAKQIGYFFILISATYATVDPIVGYTVDRVSQKWTFIFVGLIGCTISLIILGPSDFTGFENSISTNVLALILLPISIAVGNLPTFQIMLECAVYYGYEDGASTYGLVGGLWGSMQAFGEIIGPSLGAYLTENYGFHICTTIMAGYCAITAGAVFIYFTYIHSIMKTDKL